MQHFLDALYADYDYLLKILDEILSYLLLLFVLWRNEISKKNSWDMGSPSLRCEEQEKQQ